MTETRRIAGIGNAGQERLLRARVCVVGLGGLGSSAAYYLAAAGVGVLGLVDSDRVELSNLQRQVLHEVGTVGWPKSTSAARALSVLNPDVHLEPRQVRLTEDNAPEILSLFDIVVEATDNFDTKLLLNDHCLALRKPLVTAGILGLSGHAMLVVPGRTPCLRCMVPEAPDDPPGTGRTWRAGCRGGCSWEPASNGSHPLGRGLVETASGRLRPLAQPGR